MADKLLILFLGVAYIALMGYLSYKIFCFIIDKCVNSILRSRAFALVVLLTGVAFFFLVGGLMLQDLLYVEPPDTQLYFHCPLTLGLAVFLLYFGVKNIKYRRK